MDYNKCNTNILRENVMKKFLFYVLILSVLVLAACGETEDNSSEEEGVATGESTNEMSELEEENEELRRQLEEQDDEDGDSEATGEAESNGDPSEPSDDSESTEAEDNQDDNTEGNRSDLVFDINSSEVLSQLIGTDSGNSEGNFEQDSITIGMSQTEVEEMYGAYDFTLESPYGIVPAVYGNLSVLYSEGAPSGEGEDLSSTDIDPNNNLVLEVHFFANVTEEKLIDALGEPDEIYNIVDGSTTYHYQGTGEDSRYFNTNADTSITPDGEVVGIVKRNIEDENPDDITNSANEGSYFGDEAHTEGFPVTLTEEDDYFIYDTLGNFIFRTYLNSLSDYYNDVDDEILNLTESSALQQVQENKESGYFQDYQSISGGVLSIEQISENEYSVTVNRTYSHASSNGEETTQVTYTVVDTDDMLKVSNF